MQSKSWLALSLVGVIGCADPASEPDAGGVDAGAAVDGAADDAAIDFEDAAVADAAIPLEDGAVADGAVTDAGPVDATGTDAAQPPVGEVIAPPYLMWSTQTEVTVRWETATASVGSVAYGPTPALDMLAVEPAPVTDHELRLTDLTPDQQNYYRIGFDGYQLPMRSFLTAPPDDDTTGYRFVVWGDNQNGVATFEGLVDLMIDEDPSFALSVGDTVQEGTRANFRNQLIGPISPLADHVPFLVAGGNHSRYTDPNLFDEYFSQPGDEHCFGWRRGELFFLVIDTEITSIDPGSPQGDCITGALGSAAATEASFRVALFHKPPRIEWWYGGLIAFTTEMEAPWVREQLEPMLEAYDVDLIFNGHNHLYAYSPEDVYGVTLVTTGGGGGSIDTDYWMWKVDDWPQIETTIHDFHFLSVDVTPDAMVVTAIGTDGDPIHQFTVTAD